jgi:cell division protease FtsH
MIYNDLTVGAENDLERATSMARRMVTHWGMSKKLGPVSYKMTEEDPFLGREIHQNRQFSEHTMEVIDEEVARILQEASASASRLLEAKKDDLRKIAESLVENEELDRHEIRELIGKSVHKQIHHGALETVDAAPELNGDSERSEDQTGDGPNGHLDGSDRVDSARVGSWEDDSADKQ